MTLRILRAFGWMRWRVLLNSLERTSGRDTLERLSLAVDQLGPIVAALLLVPSLLGMAALSGYAGYTLAGAPRGAFAFEVLRFLTLAVAGLAVLGPLVLPVMERPNSVRLLLLPIGRGTLYVAQASSALADPWTLVFMPVVLCLPLGLAAGGAAQAAPLALVAGLLFLLAIVGLSTLTSCAVQLVVRDRRRGERVALALVLLLPLVAVLTNVLGHNVSRRNRDANTTPVQRSTGLVLAKRLGEQAFVLTPSERYVHATRAAAEGRSRAGVGSLLLLAGTATLLHGLALLAFFQLLTPSASATRRRTAPGRRRLPARIPGISPAASAVAVAQLRLALRTPRGRSTLLSPLLVFLVLAFVALTRDTGPAGLIPGSGIGLAAFGAAFSILATLPFALNQFAVDGAGLTLELLSPVSEDDLLSGKAIANGILAGTPGLFCVAAAFWLFPHGALALWISVPLGAASMCLVLAPAAAALSAIFPRVVDLNSIGSGSNAHGVASLLGVGSVIFSALPPAALAALAIVGLNRPSLTPLLLLAWCAVAAGLNRLLARPVRRLLAARRENLNLVVG